MRIIEGQFFAHLAWVIRDAALVVSGAYKLEKTQVGDQESSTGWRPCTEQEKFKDAVNRLNERCHQLSQLCDHLEE